MKYRPPGREASETPSTPGRAAVARGRQRCLPASFEAAREAMERAREPPHPYQQLRIQGQQAHAPPSSKASPPQHGRRAVSPARRRCRCYCRAAVGMDIAWIGAGVDADAGQ